MKRLITILFLVFISLNLSAQIQRTFLGCTIGEPIQSVKDKLEKQGFKINNQSSIGQFHIRNAQFGGEYWWYVTFSISGEKLGYVEFKLHQEDGEFKRLNDKLMTKYKDYYRSNESTEGEDISSFYKVKKVYFDGMTECIVTLENNTLTMKYYPKQSESTAFNEL
ncbi:MAG: hypothetical protein MJZ16_00575 [Bacteroidales bacterium]|nr:hypothetical protein [Bacteroidales bacterium]